MTTTTYQLLLLNLQPPRTFVVGCWPADVVLPSPAAPPPLFTVAIVADLSLDDAALLDAAHAAVEAVLGERDVEAALALRAQRFVDVVLPHQHTTV